MSEATCLPVHIVCQAHIDPVWIWDWPEGLSETLATFEAAADLLDEYPDFVFNHNESVLYEWARDFRPELFTRIRQHVADGRWVISGGWFLQPDANLPAGESIARHILIGRAFFREHFGVEPQVAYNLDTFGHNANIPQFLKLAGYGMYTHFRPMPWERELPDFLYRWRGVDGSEVIGFRPPCLWYCTHPGSLVPDKIDEMRKLAAERGRETTMFWGAGNHGGGATRADLDTIRALTEKHPELTQSSFERYYREVAAPLAEELPLVHGEHQRCFTGCYTSVIGHKLRNRRGEGLALAAERFAALAWWLLEEQYPAERLRAVWKDVLFNQFHDILPGSSIREGVESAAERTGRAVTDAREIMLQAQLALVRSPDDKAPLTLRVLNPHPVARTIPATVDVQLATHPAFITGKYLGLYDAKGHGVPRQLLAYKRNTAEWRATLLFDAELPAGGLSEYSIRVEEANAAAATNGVQKADNPDDFLQSAGKQLHDSSCRIADHRAWYEISERAVRVDADGFSAVIDRGTGSLVSLLEFSSGAQFLEGPSARLLVRADSNDAWGGTQSAYGAVVGSFTVPDAETLSEITGQYGEQQPAPAVRVVGSGPLAVVVESVMSYKRSVARLRYTFCRRHPHIDIELLLNWNERRRAAQLELSTSIGGGCYEVEIPHATVRRPRNNGEEPMGRWLTLTDGERALALVNDGPGGVEVAGGVVRQTLVRSATYCSGNDAVEPGYLGEHMDLGEHIYHFKLLFGATDAVVAERQLATDDLTLPLSYHCSLPLDGSDRPGLPAGTPSVQLDRVHGDGRVHLEAMKVSEDGSALVVRLAERGGAATTARLEVPGAASMELAFRGYEMKTLRVERGGSLQECDLLER